MPSAASAVRRRRTPRIRLAYQVVQTFDSEKGRCRMHTAHTNTHVHPLKDTVFIPTYTVYSHPYTTGKYSVLGYVRLYVRMSVYAIACTYEGRKRDRPDCHHDFLGDAGQPREHGSVSSRRYIHVYPCMSRYVCVARVLFSSKRI